MYFKLNPECLFVVGDKGSIICDAFNNRIFHLNPEESDILIKAEQGNIITFHPLYLELEQKCLGTFYDNLPYIQKIRKDPINFTKDIDFTFKRFFLELTDICNNSCSYCGSKKQKRSLGCLGCNTFDEDGVYLNLNEFFRVIDVIENIGCEELYFVGGDITLNWEFNKKIIDYCNNKFQNMFISISCKNLSKKILNELLLEDIHLIIQIDFQSLNKFNLLSLDNVFYLIVVFEEDYGLLNKFEDKLNNINYVFDFLTINRNIPNPNLDKNYNFDLNSFFHNLEFHPCLGKSLFCLLKEIFVLVLCLKQKNGEILKIMICYHFYMKIKKKFFSFGNLI